MCLLISNLAVGSYNNERQIPEEITITFSNGEKVIYEPCNEKPRGQTKLAHFKRPKFDVAEEKTDATTFEALEAHYTAQLRSLNETYRSQVKEAETLYSQVKADIKDFFERRDEANDQLWSTLSKGMLVNYQSVKKSLDRKIQALNDPVERLKLMVQWLKDTKALELLEAARIFESETDYILKKLQSPAKKWDSFLSHVQKDASDLCRNIKERLHKYGVATWWDKAANRIDNKGMTDGIIDSSLFTLVLTKDYFKRRYCIYEYCLALVAQKPVIAISESDERYGGGSINSFKLEGIFKHVLSHEIIEVHRTYWDAFIQHLHSRIQQTLKSNSMSLIRVKGKEVVISDPIKEVVMSDSPGIESIILKEDEMAFLENETSFKKTSSYCNKNFPKTDCSESTEKHGATNPMDSDDSEEQIGEPSVEGSREDSLQGELEVKEELPQEQVPIMRDPKHVFSIKFKMIPLGIILTSDKDGTSAYVTEVNEKRNEAIKNDKLPLNSKLLKLNGKDIELDYFGNIIKVIAESLESLPLELTFCHPDGLNENEVPDPNPDETK